MVKFHTLIVTLSDVTRDDSQYCCNIYCFSIATLSCAKNRNLGQNFLEFFNASGENRTSLSIQFLYPLPVFIQRMVMM